MPVVLWIFFVLEEKIGNYSQTDYVGPLICVWSYLLALIVLTNVVFLKVVLKKGFLVNYMGSANVYI